MPKVKEDYFEKITLKIAGKPVTIEHENPVTEAKIAAQLLALESGKAAPKAKATIKAASSVSLQKMIQSFIAESKLNCAEKTTEASETIYQLLVEVLRNPAADTVSYKEAVAFKDTLLKLPTNRTKGAYAGKSVRDLVKKPHQNPLSISSVNKYLQKSSQLFNWGMRHGMVHQNPFQGLQISDKTAAHKRRDRFTIEELKILFSPKNLNRTAMKSSYQYWLPWLGLYTGCRLDELCQLHLEDNRQEGETWILDINALSEKKLKSISSERFVPLHPKILSLGFIEHVEALKAKGETRLFPELKKGRDGYGAIASKWFARYRKTLSIEKPYHSFRHTFADELRQKGADQLKIAALCGHTDDSMTGGTYCKPYGVTLLKPVVELLNFDI